MLEGKARSGPNGLPELSKKRENFVGEVPGLYV